MLTGSLPVLISSFAVLIGNPATMQANGGGEDQMKLNVLHGSAWLMFHQI